MKRSPLLLLALAFLFVGCKQDQPLPLSNGQIFGRIAHLQLPDPYDLTTIDKSGEALLIQNGDTIARQYIESESYFASGYFSFEELEYGVYELIIRKQGFSDRHFAEMRIDANQPSLSGSLDMYLTPQLNIDTLSSSIIIRPNFYPSPFGFFINAKFSSVDEEGPYQPFIGYYRNRLPVSPSQKDFQMLYSAYKPELNDTILFHSKFFENGNYQSGDTMYAYYAPILHLIDNVANPFGESVKEFTYPNVNTQNAKLVKMVIP